MQRAGMQRAGMQRGVLRRLVVSVISGASFLLASCGGGNTSAAGTSATTPVTNTSASAYTPPAAEALTTSDVQQILAQAITQAQADGKPAVISVTDRVGNVLALFRMIGAPANVHIADAPSGAANNIQLEGLEQLTLPPSLFNLTLRVPAEASAIAKAVTGAYLSSGGNAFSTRTASEIVQVQFPPGPGTVGLGSGPLFGVQFSQLPCSDLSQRFGNPGVAALIGPKRSPLGLSADPGGFPLYKNGVVVGGIGVEADGLYETDPNAEVANHTIDERIAVAGTEGFDAPAGIVADKISVVGTLLLYSDVTTSQLGQVTNANFASASAAGQLEPLIGYTAGAIIAGSAYGTEASGIRAATSAEFGTAGAYVLSDGAGNDRYPIRAGTDGADIAAPLTAAEVNAALTQAYAVMSKARAQIRNPVGSIAEVSITVVDTHGVALGLVRAPDAPIFGIDVALQKARTAAFFSNAAAAAQLTGNPGPTAPVAGPKVASFVGAMRSFLNDPNALTGHYAFTDRAGGDLSRPNFPDGTVGNPNGPLSVPESQFTPFATGLQTALILDNVAFHLLYITGATAFDTNQRCTLTPDVAPGQNRLQNGIQVFPGSVPIYRGSTLVGALGISGDGIDQDDMVSFLGLNNAAVATGTINNAPPIIRADNITVNLPNHTSANLLYINCPQSPFINSSAQNVCAGL